MKTTQQVDEPDKKPPNPEGKGGFGDNPQNRNPGGWRKEVSFSYQYKRFMAMSGEELEKWSADTDKKNITVIEDLAFRRVTEARRSLPDVKEITDRTEGKPKQTVDDLDPRREILDRYLGGENARETTQA